MRFIMNQLDKREYYHRLTLPDLEVVTSIVENVRKTIEKRPENKSQNNGWAAVYAIGSRAVGTEHEGSDVDLLVAHNLWYMQGGTPEDRDDLFAKHIELHGEKHLDPIWGDHLALASTGAVIASYPLRKPRITGELPTTYLEGAKDRKVLARFVGPLKCGLSGVDLVIFRGVDCVQRRGQVEVPEVDSIEEFTTTVDIDSDGIQLPRVPLLEWSPAESIPIS